MQNPISIVMLATGNHFIRMELISFTSLASNNSD